MVYVEHCVNCESHGYHTRHRSEVYLQHFQQLQESIVTLCPELSVQANVVPAELETRFYSPEDPRWKGIKPVGRYRFPRVGAFEVVFRGRTVFSKLDGGLWPNNRAVARKVRDLLDGVEPLLEDQRPATRSLATRQGKRGDSGLPSVRSHDAFPPAPRGQFSHTEPLSLSQPAPSYTTEEIPVDLQLHTKGNHEVPQTNDTGRRQTVTMKCDNPEVLQVPDYPLIIEPGATIHIPLIFAESPVETVRKCVAFLYIDGKVAECLKFTVFYKEYANPADKVLEGCSHITLPLDQKVKRHFSYVNHTEVEQHVQFLSSDKQFLKVKKPEVTVLPGEAMRVDVKFKKVKEPGTHRLALDVLVDGKQGPVYEFEATYGN